MTVPDTPCRVCERPHTQARHPHLSSCVRHKRDGTPCLTAPLRGLTVCKSHGGNSPTGQKRHQATVAAQAMGLDPALVAANPLAALSAYATETARQYRWATDELNESLTSLDDAVYLDVNGTERTKGKVQVWERVCDRTERALGALAKLNIDERLTRLEEAKVAFVIGAIEAALEAAGFDTDQRERARLAIGNELARGRPQLSPAPR